RGCHLPCRHQRCLRESRWEPIHRCGGVYAMARSDCFRIGSQTRWPGPGAAGCVCAMRGPSPLFVFLLCVAAMFATAGQLLFKVGANNASHWKDFLNWPIAMGLTSYGISTVLWIVAL